MTSFFYDALTQHQRWARVVGWQAGTCFGALYVCLTFEPRKEQNAFKGNLVTCC